MRDLLALGVLAFVGVNLLYAAYQSVSQRSFVRLVVSGMRLTHFLLAIPVLVAVVTTAIVLSEVPGLSFSWWAAIGGHGSPALGMGPSSAVGSFHVVLPLLFCVVLVVGLPLVATAEEWVFRWGAEHRSLAGNLRWAVLFGLVHAVVGVPIATALALSITGVYLTWCYLRVWGVTGSSKLALLESTRAHLAYNLVIVLFVFTALVLRAGLPV